MKKVLIFLMLTMGLVVGAQTVSSFANVKLTKLKQGTLRDSVVVVNGKTKELGFYPISELKVVTNLDYWANPEGGVVFSSTGNDAIVPIATRENAGLLSGADKLRLDLMGASFGDGIGLPISLPASDVYPWAKQVSKPVYTTSEVGLGDVDNTSDFQKPISTAMQVGLDLKENLSRKNRENGYAGLDVSGKIAPEHLPAVLITSVFGRVGAVEAQANDYDTNQIFETSTRVFQTPFQKLNNDATSSIQTQLNTINSATAVVSLNEGNGTGIVLARRNALHYGNIGDGAIDFSKNTFENSIYGATGTNSVVLAGIANQASKSNAVVLNGYGNVASGNNSFIGNGTFVTASGSNSAILNGVNNRASGSNSVILNGTNIVASGNYSTTFNGSNITASGDYTNVLNGSGNVASANYASILNGASNVASGQYSLVLNGFRNNSSSFGEISGGQFCTEYTPQSAITFNSLDRLFVLGNGTESLRSNAFNLLKNGLLTLPSVTNALIDAEPTGKAVVTKEWVTQQSNFTSYTFGEEVSTTSSVPVAIDNLKIAPGVAGKYRVDFNGNYDIIPGNLCKLATLDLQTLYLNLMNIPSKNSHGLSFGSGETIAPGVYTVDGAMSVAGILKLDGGGNPNSLFVFRVNGAINTAIATTIQLINGANAANVFFTAIGAVGIGADNVVSGNFIAYGAAAALGANCIFNGRLFSTSGALAFASGTQTKPTQASVIELGILSNFLAFTNEGNVANTALSGITGDLGTAFGNVTVFANSVFRGDPYDDKQQLGITNVFSIYVDGVLLPVSERIRKYNNYTQDISLLGIVNLSDMGSIEIRWKTDLGRLIMRNRILTVTRIKDATNRS